MFLLGPLAPKGKSGLRVGLEIASLTLSASAFFHMKADNSKNLGFGSILMECLTQPLFGPGGEAEAQRRRGDEEVVEPEL